MLKKVFSKNNVILLLILLLGLSLRTFQLKERFLYSHDQDLLGWFIKDVVVDKHLRLVGQETSTQGVFIGPFFYYLQIPFYLFTGMDPIGGTYLVTLLGLFSIWSFYFVFSKCFNKQTGLIAAFIYSLSYYMIFNDREVVPTMPAILWSVWFLYATIKLLRGEQRKGFLIFGILIGLVWHINFALVLPILLIPMALYLSKKKLEYRNLIPGLVTLIVTSLPLLLFEVRHGFQQTKAIFAALTVAQSDTVFSGYEKLQRVIYLLSKNIHGVFMGNSNWLSYRGMAISLLIIFIYLSLKKILDRRVALVSFIWIFLYILFFSSYSKIVSEYYLNGCVVIFVLVISLFNSYLIDNVHLKHLGFMILSLFFVYNLNQFFSYKINASGYIQRRAIISEIKRDAADRNYPCVAISYITDPGYNLGYRYFFWLEKMHTTNPESLAPVYTIVFPLKPIFATNVNKGAIGLIYPNYGSYTKEGIEESCSGENSNLTDPLFGFTK